MARQYPDALPAGYALQEYTVRRVLGQGGFGITYLAYDEGLAKEVAIKEYFPVEFASRHGDDSVSPRSDADNDDYEWGLTRFQEEARTLVLFRHPAIVPVYRRFEENGTAYMVMEYQVGESLSELMKRHLDDFTEPDLMNMARPVLDGLAEVHKAGYLHRDLKPGNIYIRRDGSPVLLDFGAARAAVGHKSRSLTSIVTPGYAPLEQYFAEGNQGPWTDIYAFAAMLYQCVTAKLPPEAPARVRKDTMIPAADAAKGRFSEPFLRAIDAGLAINEEDRPQDVTTWLMMLEGDELVGAGRAPDETVALAAAGRERRAAEPAPVVEAAAAAAPARAAGRGRQEPSFRASSPPPPAAAAASGGRMGRAGRIAIFATAGILLAGAGAAGGWLVVGGPDGGSGGGGSIADGRGNGGGGTVVPDGNGGGGGTDASLTPEEKRKRALAEAQRKAREEAERKRKAEAERKAREEAERKQKAEAERKRRAEAERKRKAEADRKRREEADRKRRAEEARKRREREEAERRRQEQEAERRRKAREEAERRRKACEEEERKRKERELAARNQVSCAFLLRPIRSIGTTKRDCDLIAVAYVQALTNGYAGVTRGWRNRTSGARGTITILRSVKRADGRFCRVFQQTVIRGGVYRRSNGTACLFGNQWRIVG